MTKLQTNSKCTANTFSTTNTLQNVQVHQSEASQVGYRAEQRTVVVQSLECDLRE